MSADKKLPPDRTRMLHEHDLPFYLQLDGSANPVRRTVKVGSTPTGHDVMADLDADGHVVGIEVI